MPLPPLLDRLRLLLQLAPLAFGVIVLGGIVLSLGSLVGVAHPDLGFFRSNSHDALALYSGQGIYRNPDHGYTGLLYTPGLPAAVAVLDHLKLWDGWATLLTTLGVLASACVVAAVAYPRTAPGTGGLERGWLALRALGVGALAIWLFSPLTGDLLFQAGPDQLAWAFAIAGLVLASGYERSRWRAAGAIACLTAAVWVKQPTVMASVAVAIWLLWLGRRGERSWRSVLGFIGALAAVNLIVLGIVNLTTHGWEFFFNVVLPRKQSNIYTLRTSAKDVVKGLGVGMVAVAAIWLASWRSWTAPRRSGLPTLLVIFTVVGGIGASYFRQKQGGEDNQFIGVGWALGLLAAVAWSRARSDRRAALMTDGVIALVLVLAFVGTQKDNARLNLHGFRTHFTDTTAQLRAYAATRSVYHPIYSDVSYVHDHRVWQDVPNLGDLLASDRQPRELVRALLDRKFEAVTPYLAAIGAGNVATFDAYGGAYGKYEEGYFSKLDAVIAARYRPAPPGAPPGMLVRRVGPERDAWMRSCFGPFTVGGARWDIRSGGGFWCHFGSAPVLTLRQTTAPLSEVATRDAVSPRGQVIVGLRPNSNAFKVRLDRQWQLLGTRVGHGPWELQLVDRSFKRAVASVDTPGKLVLRLGAGTSGPAALKVDGIYVDVLAGKPGATGRLQLFGPQQDGIAYDLRGLRL